MLPFDPDILPFRRGVYVVGGAVRDALRGSSPLDFDLAVDNDAGAFATRLASACDGHFVHLGKDDKAVFRVVKPPHTFDIVPLWGQTISADLGRRDFTVNAMAYDLATGMIVDPFGGQQDLTSRRLRLVGKRAFQDDPVRLLRAYRIAAVLDFEVAPETRRAIRRDAHLIPTSAAERQQAEINRLVQTSRSHKYLTQMVTDSLLTAIIPEFGDLAGCIQNEYHQFDVLEHTLAAYQHLESMLNEPAQHLPRCDLQIGPHLKDDRVGQLKLALLLHDIGKPTCKTVDNRNKIHFYGHGQKSADLARIICQRLKFSRRAIQYIDFIIRNHLRALFLFIASQQSPHKHKAMVRFFRKCGPLTPDLLLHTIADIMGKGRTSRRRDVDFIHFADDLLHFYFEEFAPQASAPPLITGHDLIQELGLKPSPFFKRVLRQVEEARLTGRIQSRREALSLARKASSRLSTERVLSK